MSDGSLGHSSQGVCKVQGCIVQSTLTSYNQYGVGVKGQRGKPELFTNGVLRVSIPSAIASLGFFECLHIYISFLFYIFV